MTASPADMPRGEAYRLSLVAAMLLLALAVSGCTGGAGPLTAKEALEASQPNAAAWDTAAVLVGLATREETLATLPDGAEETFPGVADADVGDGRVPQWFMTYRAPSKEQALVVGIYGDGRIITHEEPAVDQSGRALGHATLSLDDVVDQARWRADSIEVAKAAMEVTPFKEAAGVGGIHYALHPGYADTPRPFWTVVAFAEDGTAACTLYFDGATGQRWWRSPRDYDCPGGGEFTP